MPANMASKAARAVDEERGVVVARERHFGQLFEGHVLGIELLVADAEESHFLFQRAGQVVDLRIAGAACFDVSLEFAAANEAVGGQREPRART